MYHSSCMGPLIPIQLNCPWAVKILLYLQQLLAKQGFLINWHQDYQGNQGYEDLRKQSVTCLLHALSDYHRFHCPDLAVSPECQNGYQ